MVGNTAKIAYRTVQQSVRTVCSNDPTHQWGLMMTTTKMATDKVCTRPHDGEDGRFTWGKPKPYHYYQLSAKKRAEKSLSHHGVFMAVTLRQEGKVYRRVQLIKPSSMLLSCHVDSIQFYRVQAEEDDRVWNDDDVSLEPKTATSLPAYGKWAQQAEGEPRIASSYLDTAASCDRVRDSTYRIKEDETTALVTGRAPELERVMIPYVENNVAHSERPDEFVERMAYSIIAAIDGNRVYNKAKQLPPMTGLVMLGAPGCCKSRMLLLLYLLLTKAGLRVATLLPTHAAIQALRLAMARLSGVLEASTINSWLNIGLEHDIGA